MILDENCWHRGLLVVDLCNGFTKYDSKDINEEYGPKSICCIILCASGCLPCLQYCTPYHNIWAFDPVYPSVKLPFSKVWLSGGPDRNRHFSWFYTFLTKWQKGVLFSLFYLQCVSCLLRGMMTAMLIPNLETMREIIPMGISKPYQYHHCLSFNQMWL